MFKDHFSQIAQRYADFRPRYPDALFAWLASLTAQHELAWDCACGSGQASPDLARFFARVIATDASAAQLAQAAPHAAVEYRVALAEESGLEPQSIDLLIVAQALHWFDLPRFYAEAQRVLRPGGVIAAWTYGTARVLPAAIDAPLRHFYSEVVGPYWPAERRHVENGYRELPFPFAEIAPPAFQLQVSWSRAQFVGYLRSWSATARFVKERGFDPAVPLDAELARLWPHDAPPCAICWPLALRVGRWGTPASGAH